MKNTRRDFIAGLGGLAAGIAGTGLAKTALEAPSREIPLSYAILDVEETRKLAHNMDYTSNCASGAFAAIVSQLREKIGSPWTEIPLDLYAYAGGGVNGWGTLCGALNGCAGVITLAAGKKDQSRLVNELFSWYTGASLPGEESNSYAREKSWGIEKSIFAGELPASISQSPLCHVSIARWCKSSGYSADSPARDERCARLCGDVAAKTVELLNSWKKGTLTTVSAGTSDKYGCMRCHTPGKEKENKNSIVGKMDCAGCHKDQIKK